MSREALGDEGNVATHWEETLLRVTMDEVIRHFDQWRRDYRSEFPNQNFLDLADHVVDTFDQMQAELTGMI